MKPIKQIICWWKGHQYPEVSRRHRNENCPRCGEYMPYGDSNIFYPVWNRIAYWWRNDRCIRIQIHRREKCTDCGKSFAKRNSHDQCIPF